MASITIRKGNILSIPTDAVVIPVNCVGVMGAGLAKVYADVFPDIIAPYQEMCNQKLMQPGRTQIYHKEDKPNIVPQKIIHDVYGEVYIPKRFIFFPTKNHWRFSSRYEWIKEGMQDLLSNFLTNERFKNIETLIIPKIGTGRGGLNWQKVRPIILEYAERFPIPHIIINE